MHVPGMLKEPAAPSTGKMTGAVLLYEGTQMVGGWHLCVYCMCVMWVGIVRVCMFVCRDNQQLN